MTAEKLPPTAIEIVDKVEPLIRTLPADKREEIRHVITTAIAFQGPLPPPQMLAEYGQVVADAPERIIRLLEKQTDHRIAMETALVTGQVASVSKGQNMAFALSILFGLVAGVLGFFNHDILAGVIGGTTIVGLATVFVIGRTTRESGDAEPDEPEHREPDRTSAPSPKAQGKRNRR